MAESQRLWVSTINGHYDKICCGPHDQVASGTVRSLFYRLPKLSDKCPASSIWRQMKAVRILAAIDVIHIKMSLVEHGGVPPPE